VPPRRSDDFEAALAKLDVSLFSHIQSQTSVGDKTSLLALELGSRERWGGFSYLEIGSHLGGSLQPFVADPACEAIVSIDPRPKLQPDDRLAEIEFPDNSTERMRKNLERVPGADLAKLTTIEATSADVDPGSLPVRPQLCFIDGEHTHDAALADARFCEAAIAGSGCIAFHDDSTVRTALRAFVRDLTRRGVPFVAYPVPKKIFVVELGDAGLHRTGAMRTLFAGPVADRPRLTRFLARSAGSGSRGRRALLRIWLSDYGGLRSRSLPLRLRLRRLWKRFRLRQRRRYRRVRDAIRPRLRAMRKRARRRSRRIRKRVIGALGRPRRG
jgi:Methyltransferase domain